MFCREQFISGTLQPLIWIVNKSNWIIAGTLRDCRSFLCIISARQDSFRWTEQHSCYCCEKRDLSRVVDNAVTAGDFFPKRYKHQLGTKAPLPINHLKISLCVMLPGLRARAAAGHRLALWWHCGPVAQKPPLKFSCQGRSSLSLPFITF